MKYFKFIGKSKKWGWAENPENGKTYSLKQFCEMYGPAQWNGGENLTQNQMLTQIIQRDSCWQEVPKPKKSLSEKIEKLKKQAEKEGMGCEVVLYGPSPLMGALKDWINDGHIKAMEQALTATNPKDEWEGVEYGEFLETNSSERFIKGRIYKLVNGKNINDDSSFYDEQYEPNGFEGRNNKYFKPSTESAYVEQLKAKAKELFGDIKDQDVFDQPNGQKNNAIILNHPFNMDDLYYNKTEDTLRVRRFLVYQQGKWAKKLPKSVKAHITEIDYGLGGEQLKVKFVMENSKSFDPEETSRFLASQLEKYLNGEIE